ncbi:MAG: hypothetical protein N3A01_03800 [Bacteroidales bacterium]|nr:hypothetical protein [Bacteroidales bacterium]
MKQLILLILPFYIAFSNPDTLYKVEKKLKFYYETLYFSNSLSDTQKLVLADSINFLYRNLNINDLFYYKFDSLKKYISSIYAIDSSLRIITWFVRLQENYKYYGYVIRKMNNDFYKLYVLDDMRIEYNDTTRLNEVLCNGKWIGSIYTYVHVCKYKDKIYYILFGFDDYNKYVTRKIVDVLYFKGNKICFGAPVFYDHNSVKNRLVFTYSEKAKFLCQFRTDMNAIVFDYLCPIKPEFKGMYEFYGPDGTYDAYFYSKGKWYLKKNIKVLGTDIKK